MQSLISEHSVTEKDWDRDSAIGFEEVKVSIRKPRLRTLSSSSSHSRRSVEQAKTSSHVNLSYVSEELVPAAKVRMKN